MPVIAAPPTRLTLWEEVIEIPFKYPIASGMVVCAAGMTDLGVGFIGTIAAALGGAGYGMFGGFYLGLIISPLFSIRNKGIMLRSSSYYIGPALGALTGAALIAPYLPHSQFIGSRLARTGIAGLSSCLIFIGRLQSPPCNFSKRNSHSTFKKVFTARTNDGASILVWGNASEKDSISALLEESTRFVSELQYKDPSCWFETLNGNWPIISFLYFIFTN